MGPGPLTLGDTPQARLVPDAARNADHADVVHQRRPAEHDDIGGRQPELRTGLPGQFGDSPGMAQAQRRLQVAEIGERAERQVELVVTQCHAELRVERDHLLPRRDAAQPGENLRVPSAEAVDQARIKLRTPPLTGHSQRRLGAASMMERLDAVS